MIYPIELLIKDQKLVVADENDTVRDALTLMVANNFSQLPVVDKQGRLSGVISEQSISRHYLHVGDQVKLLDLKVVDCSERPVTLDVGSAVLEALSVLRNATSVVIVSDHKPVGIITNADAILFFRDISEGLVLIEDMEVTLRQDIDEVFSTDDEREQALRNAFGHRRNTDGTLEMSYDRLTLGDYVNLIANKRNWQSFESRLVSKELFQSYMGQVREMRNQLTHFRGRLDSVQFSALEHAHYWLEGRHRHYNAMSQTIAVGTLNLTLEPVTIESQGAERNPQAISTPTEGKYGPLQDYLLAEANRNDMDARVTYTFQQVEEILGDELPESARQHRSWWSNDSTSPFRHSMAWLQSGWELADVDITSRQVTFRKTEIALRRVFWAELVEQLRSKRPGFNPSTKTYAKNYLFFSAGKPGFNYGWFLPSNMRELWTQLYIDTRGTDSKSAKRYFNLLQQQKDDIEEKNGEELVWDDTSDRYAVRIYAARPFQIDTSPEELEAAKLWALDSIQRLADTMQPRIAELD